MMLVLSTPRALEKVLLDTGQHKQKEQNNRQPVRHAQLNSLPKYEL